MFDWELGDKWFLLLFGLAPLVYWLAAQSHICTPVFVIITCFRHAALAAPTLCAFAGRIADTCAGSVSNRGGPAAYPAAGDAGQPARDRDNDDRRFVLVDGRPRHGGR